MSTLAVTAVVGVALMILVTLVPRRSSRPLPRSRPATVTSAPPAPARATPAPATPIVAVPAPRRPRTATNEGAGRAVEVRLAHVRAATILLAETATGPAAVPTRTPQRVRV